MVAIDDLSRNQNRMEDNNDEKMLGCNSEISGRNIIS